MKKILFTLSAFLFILSCAKPAASGASANSAGSVVKLNSVAEFDAFLASHPAVIADLYADWCGPCKMIEPVLNSLAPQFKGRTAFVRVNVDEVPAIAARYQANAIPLVIVIKNGSEVNRLVGVQDEQTYRSAAESIAK